MDWPAVIAAVVIAALGSSALTAVVAGLFGRGKNKTDQYKVLQQIWTEEMQRLESRVTKLEAELGAREVIIEQLKSENKDLQAELKRLKAQNERLMKTNRELHEEQEHLRITNRELTERIRLMEERLARFNDG
jgi:predicted RNase H-like nuclease (RuvC/YqgF family)